MATSQNGVQQVRLNALRRLLPKHEVFGWAPHLWLIYLIYLFLPFVTFPRGDLHWLWPTLLTLPVFLWLYRFYLRGRQSLSRIVAIALLSYALTPFNPAAFTYLAFAAAFLPSVVRGLLRPVLVTLGLLAVQAAETFYLRQSPLNLAVIVVICLMCCSVTYFHGESWRKNQALKLSQDEIRRLAAVAERERIGRDLHDLLGHTLSLIALKSELAGRLVGRDPAAAAREIVGVTHVAREALRQVRTAVMGIRSAELITELVSAQALLASSGVELTSRRDETALPPEVQTALAMIVRESVTNIQRHAGATRAHIEVTVARAEEGSSVTLSICDDGRGGAIARRGCSGLTGMAERVRSLGGELQVVSLPGQGTTLRVSLPLHAGSAEPAAAASLASLDE